MYVQQWFATGACVECARDTTLQKWLIFRAYIEFARDTALQQWLIFRAYIEFARDAQLQKGRVVMGVYLALKMRSLPNCPLTLELLDEEKACRMIEQLQLEPQLAATNTYAATYCL